MQEEEIIAAAKKFVQENKTKIARKLTDPNIYKPVENPISIFMAGSPGAGKTEYSKGLIQMIASAESQVIRIDGDEIRDLIPGYTGNNAHLFQGSVSVIVERVHDFALDGKQSFILDGTFSKYEKAVDNIKRSLERKRRVHIFYIYQKPEIAWKFTEAREKVEGRKIPKSAFIEQFLGAYNTINKLCKEFDTIEEVPIFLVKKDFQQNTVEVVGIDGGNKCLDDYLPNTYTKEELERII